MFFKVGRKDQDIVHVNDDPPFLHHIRENGVHHSLEGAGRVAKTEEHHSWFVEPGWTVISARDNKSSLPFVTLLDPHVVVACTKIHLCEVPRPLHLLHEVSDEGKGVAVLDRVCI